MVSTRPDKFCFGSIMKNKSQFHSGRGAKGFGRQPQKPLQNVLPTRSPALGSTFSQTLALHQAGRQAEAEQNYLQILKVQPNQFDCLHLLGVIFFSTGQPCGGGPFDEALAGYDRAPRAP
jgi:tetratricopeptide (TPR) repeat protein